MARDKAGPRRREPWEYPHDYSEDPAAEADRRELEAKLGHDGVAERAVRAYWHRQADHAKAWLESNPDAPQRMRDRALAHQVASQKSAETAGGIAGGFDLPDLERLYRRTGNPLFMWAAVSHALCAKDPQLGSAGDRKPEAATIPAWCEGPLRAAAAGIVTLSLPGMPPATSQNVAKTLGLIARGHNAYEQRRRTMMSQDRGRFAGELERAGLTPQRARKVVFPEIGDSRALRRAAKRAAPLTKPRGED